MRLPGEIIVPPYWNPLAAPAETFLLRLPQCVVRPLSLFSPTEVPARSAQPISPNPAELASVPPTAATPFGTFRLLQSVLRLFAPAAAAGCLPPLRCACRRDAPPPAPSRPWPRPPRPAWPPRVAFGSRSVSVVGGRVVPSQACRPCSRLRPPWSRSRHGCCRRRCWMGHQRAPP